MGSARHRLDFLLGTDGYIVVAEHRDLAEAARWRYRTGRLRRVLPGVYAQPPISPETRIAAVAHTLPGAVLTGAAAARLTFWPEIEVPTVCVAHRHDRAEPAGFRFSKRRIPAALIWQLPPDPLRRFLPEGVRCTSPALTAWDLVEQLGAHAIDEVLRRGAANLGSLTDALELTSGRRGNTDRRRILLDSRDEPWSPAERRAHQIFRRGRLTGWRANHPVVVRGRRYRLDIAWPSLRLAVEIDGRRWHSAPGVFESDRQRQNDLVADGWLVIRLTWAMLEDEEAVIALVHRVIRQRERQLRRSR